MGLHGTHLMKGEKYQERKEVRCQGVRVKEEPRN